MGQQVSSSGTSSSLKEIIGETDLATYGRTHF